MLVKLRNKSRFFYSTHITLSYLPIDDVCISLSSGRYKELVLDRLDEGIPEIPDCSVAIQIQIQPFVVCVYIM